MWPTMLATASERFPRGGALLMGLMGTAGTLSIQFVLPMMGAILRRTKKIAAGGDAAFNALPAGSEHSTRCSPSRRRPRSGRWRCCRQSC